MPIITEGSLTLSELHSRLTDILAENVARGWPERNHLTVAIELRSRTKTGRLRRSKYRRVAYASSAMSGIGAHGQFSLIVATDSEFTA